LEEWWQRVGFHEGLMQRADLSELHYIAPIDNIASIARHGILSHDGAAGLPHSSVSMQDMQDRRAKVVIPGGRRLHEYANLYICARNPMLYKRLAYRDSLCVLSVNTSILDAPGVVVTSANAASEYVRFAPAPEGLRMVDRDLVFAEYWTDSDQIQYFRRKAFKCAEVLVPDRIDPRYIVLAYVASQAAKERAEAAKTGVDVQMNPHMFFL
jgi:hypothetical protein